MAANGARAGHWARESATGTGQASATAKAARNHEVQNILLGYRVRLFGLRPELVAAQQFAQRFGFAVADGADEAGKHGLAVRRRPYSRTHA